ncbi:hypothetical protein DFJ58DRAFT_736949 [Suillus subalutaceus]|uniref:uncharacterized protein n=1 Tax=Suillus subalutaceus TaxID=48586 RepID=UPI001B86B982|nr:uncharacterized protein DFJ58DRAFT_736949 [Suillus subalutaceus]KAG1830493.1 hypothetical protein DFJ58DRAFT_736949 [Suillus subalutaceus]
MHVEFAQQHITSLFLAGSIQQSTLIEILSICNRVTCLFLVLSTRDFSIDGPSAPVWRALDALPLKSLVLAVNANFTSSASTLNVFQNLTHLEISDDRMLDRPNAALEGLSALTHLCVALLLGRSNPLAVIRLIGNARLRLLVFRVIASHRRVWLFLDNHEIFDHRIVLLPITLTNWAQLGHGDMLVWELAEELVNLPIDQNKGHRCLSQIQLVNVYADYNDVDRDDEYEGHRCLSQRQLEKLHPEYIDVDMDDE